MNMKTNVKDAATTGCVLVDVPTGNGDTVQVWQKCANPTPDCYK